jgi:hypothetical protein
VNLLDEFQHLLSALESNRIDYALCGGLAMVLDLLLASEATKNVWKSRVVLPWEYGTVSVVSPEGLIQLKSMRKSGQDMYDINHLKGIIDEN